MSMRNSCMFCKSGMLVMPMHTQHCPGNMLLSKLAIKCVASIAHVVALTLYVHCL